MGKQRIAILGGGMAALTAAFEITNAKGWQDRYDLTVYQLGWRLGGKGASGRNADHEQRIEEHGLHILLGFYENAFKVLRAAYAELDRPAGAPLATWKDAFKPHNYVVLMEQLANGSYEPWTMDFPPNSGVPGDGGVLPTPWELVQMVIGWLKQLWPRAPHIFDEGIDLEDAHEHAQAGNESGLLAELHEVHEWLHRKVLSVENGIDELGQYLESINWRRDAITLDLGLAAMLGMLKSGVMRTGDWFSQDGKDFREWLSFYGAHAISVNSAYISGMYDLGFSLPGQVGAGTAINGILRMCWTYKGAVMWKMQAGMGDTIFAPLYQVLKQRGVRFEFFHRVDELTLSDDGSRVETITIGRQALPKADYDPLVTVKDLPCWPSEPNYDQLADGEALKASGEDLEDWWTAWKDPVEPLVLTAGAERNGFDKAILGCSLGIFEYIAKDLIARNQKFAAMVNSVKTTQTQAAQLWMSTDLPGLGWKLPSPVLDGYAEPMDTWADMTHLLPREEWPDGPGAPKNLAYLCSPLPDSVWPLPPRTQHDYAPSQQALVKRNAISWLHESAKGLWPKAQANGDFDWSLLVGSTATGVERFDSQYWLATLNPSDRYVLAVPNSVNARLTTQGHGISNLYLAGDYLRTGMNVGCVEAATMGGMHASRAICGLPSTIIGDNTGDPDELMLASAQAAAEAVADDKATGRPYIRRGGDLAMMPPLELTNATMYSFLVNADITALQTLLDKQLNAITRAAGVTYRPLLPAVSIVCADITKSFSTTPPDSQKGWMAERDFGVWIPIADNRGRIAWYLPYVFVDNVAAMVTGREVFGFFKQTATLTMPPSPQAAGPFTIDALVIQTYSPQSEAETIRLLTATSTQSEAAPTGRWASAKDALETLWDDLKVIRGEAKDLPLSDWQVFKDALAMLATGDVPMVFLKQFRDAAAQETACYQAVIEAPARLDKFHGGWVCHPHDIVIAPAQSHPIASDCGLASGTLRSQLGFWCQMDFTMMPGRVVAQR